MTKKQALRWLGWAVGRAEDWIGYYSGHPRTCYLEIYKREVKKAKEALKFIRQSVKK